MTAWSVINLAAAAALALSAAACSDISFGDSHLANTPKTDSALTAPPVNLKNGGEE